MESRISRRLLRQFNQLQFFDHFLGRSRVDKIWPDWRKNHRLDLFKELFKGRKKGRELEIERRKDLTAEDFRKQYLAERKPVVLEGAASSWPCYAKWDLDYFDRLHGREEIILMKNVGKGTNDFKEVYQTKTLSEVITNIRGGGRQYLSFYPILQKHPEHYADFDINWLKSRRHRFTIFRGCQLFMGGAGTETALHNANQANLFVQVWGAKEWILYPSAQTYIIDPNPVQNFYREVPARNKYPFNAFEPDFKSHPYYEYLDFYRVHLKAGDVLYNPPFMWHSVRNITDSIACSYRWINPWYSFKAEPLYMLLDFFARNPNILKSIRLTREDFNLTRLAEEGYLDEYLKKKTSLNAL